MAATVQKAVAASIQERVMTEEVAVAKKKFVIAGYILAIAVLLFSVLPDMAAKHRIANVWVLLPLSLYAAAALVNAIVSGQNLMKAKRLHGEL